MDSAFVPSSAAVLKRASSSRAAVSTRRVTATPVMKASPARAHNNIARIAAAVPASVLAAAPALAEGTGEGLGIDTPLLYLPLILIPSVFFVFFIQFGRGQDNEDFTGEYDERRN